jgi:hypothetical protein
MTPDGLPARSPKAIAQYQIADLPPREQNRVEQAVDAACSIVERDPGRAIPAVAALLLYGRPGSHIMRQLFRAECKALGSRYVMKEERG